MESKICQHPLMGCFVVFEKECPLCVGKWTWAKENEVLRKRIVELAEIAEDKLASKLEENLMDPLKLNRDWFICGKQVQLVHFMASQYLVGEFGSNWFCKLEIDLERKRITWQALAYQYHEKVIVRVDWIEFDKEVTAENAKVALRPMIRSAIEQAWKCVEEFDAKR